MRKCQEWLGLEGRKAPVHYLCGYVPYTLGADELSKKLLSFKRGHYSTMEFWLNCFIDSYSDLFEKDKSDLIARSLSHTELKIDKKNGYC